MTIRIARQWPSLEFPTPRNFWAPCIVVGYDIRREIIISFGYAEELLAGHVVVTCLARNEV
jgi:hypothetical protein